MHRSELTIDLGAVRRNARRLVEVLEGAALWAVVKADGYGHGAIDVAGAVLGDGTGMGRWGFRELPEPTPDVVGLMTHLATADSDPEFAREQLGEFEAATKGSAHLVRHAANSAAALRLPESRLDAARCGIALYGLSPFGTDPADDGLEPALRWESRLAQVKTLSAGESTGYGRRFVAERDAWIGVVPVGYADGFRRDMTGTDVVVEDHAGVADTINYEIVCGIQSSPTRARRTVIDA